MLGGAESGEAMRDRLIRFYTHYHPPGLRLVDQLLHVYAGREDALMMVLQDKYGPEPDFGTLTATHLHSELPVAMASGGTLERETPSSPLIEEAVVAHLSAALKRKNDEVAMLTSRVSDLEKELSVARRTAAQATQVKTDVTVLREENCALRARLRRLTFDTQVIAQEKQQLANDVIVSGEQIAALQQRVAQLQSREETLITELGALRVSEKRPATKEEFTALIEGCRGRLREHFNERVRHMEREMKRYYQYAEKQIRDREETIALLKQNDTAVFTHSRPTTSPAQFSKSVNRD